ncbi:MAG: sulfotransferase [Kineosporiaceae bacterium]
MTLRLIGAGLPRTGTSSLRDALQHLLGAPVYHMSEALAHPEHAQGWVAAIAGEQPVWEDFLAGYVAGVDAPFSTCWRQLAAAAPDAPIVLSHRGDAEVWLRSMEATVLPRARRVLAGDAGEPMRQLFRAVFEEHFDDLDDRRHLMSRYEGWLEDVRRDVEPHRLVEWQPGDGWAPLCRALDLPVPDLPFPHANSTADYRARAAERARRDRTRREPAETESSTPTGAEQIPSPRVR